MDNCLRSMWFFSSLSSFLWGHKASVVLYTAYGRIGSLLRPSSIEHRRIQWWMPCMCSLNFFWRSSANTLQRKLASVCLYRWSRGSFANWKNGTSVVAITIKRFGSSYMASTTCECMRRAYMVKVSFVNAPAKRYVQFHYTHVHYQLN